MPCPKTQHLLTEYFADDLPAVTRSEIEKHLQACEECAEELKTLQDVQVSLSHWEEEKVPHWDRGTNLFRQEHGRSARRGRGWIWQWLPTAASFAMLCVLVFNVSLSSTENGFTVSFGGAEPGAEVSGLEQRLVQFTDSQRLEQEQTLQAFMARVDDRQDSNNLRLIQAVVEQAQQMNAENFDQMYSYFEQQRQLDMENVQVSYQQLADSDFETLRSMQQLANYVRFQGDVR